MKVAIFGSTGQAQLISVSEKINLLNKLSQSKYKKNFLIGTGFNSLIETINFMKISCSLNFKDFLIMVGIGILSGMGAYCISQAYRVAKAGFIAPFEYVALPLSIFWSIVVFGEWPDIITWIGITLISGAGLYIGYIENVEGKKNDIYIPIPRNR